MPETNNTKVNPDMNADNFKIPSDNPMPADINNTQQNTNPPVIPTDLPLNQAANQGDTEQNQVNELKPNVDSKKNQSDVFGKSELLDANKILSEILGLKTGHRVADLGAGGGLFTLQAARLVGDQGEVYAVDIMKTSLSDIESKARMANLYNVKTVWSNIEILGATKIPENTLDFIMLVNVLFQSKETNKMISEAHRLLKKGGKMLVIDWSDTSTGMGPHKDHQINPSDIVSTARSMNLNLEQQFVAGQYHFGLVFVK